ncbi:IS66 family transposase, partial [Pseudomonas aeruginosa]|uniref:IS66 family transposase n=1 Tax=Pseudomonas aeruginosa TaxID=287 RepID=UPI003B28D122
MASTRAASWATGRANGLRRLRRLQGQLRARRDRDRLHGPCTGKFFDLHAANQSQLAEQALQYIGQLYEVEREGRELLAAQRRQLRQDKARPIIDGLHSWMLGQRQKVPEGSAIAKALDYSLKRWAALVRYL